MSGRSGIIPLVILHYLKIILDMMKISFFFIILRTIRRILKDTKHLRPYKTSVLLE